jgi:curved DNA-binding protein
MALVDLYAVLGVPPTASAEEVRRSYRRLALQHHPDLHDGDPQAEERFREIAAAYEVLGDVQRRAAYDGRRPTPAPHQRPDAGKGDTARPSRPQRNVGTGTGPPRPGHRPEHRTGHAQLELTLAEVVYGGEKALVLDLPDGKEYELHLSVPAGTTDGDVLRALLPPGYGDVAFSVRVAPHPTLRREPGSPDLLTEVPLPLSRAIFGGQVDIPTLEGPVSITVAPGTQSGHRAVLLGRGGRERAGRRGDLRAVLQVVVPTDLSDEARELMERFVRLTEPG